MLLRSNDNKKSRNNRFCSARNNLIFVVVSMVLVRHEPGLHGYPGALQTIQLFPPMEIANQRGPQPRDARDPSNASVYPRKALSPESDCRST